MIGSTIERIHETDSTNNYAATCLLTKRPLEGAVYVADSQIDGRLAGAVGGGLSGSGHQAV